VRQFFFDESNILMCAWSSFDDAGVGMILHLVQFRKNGRYFRTIGTNS
jgi:hypothetical protein